MSDDLLTIRGFDDGITYVRTYRRTMLVAKSLSRLKNIVRMFQNWFLQIKIGFLKTVLVKIGFEI